MSSEGYEALLRKTKLRSEASEVLSSIQMRLVDIQAANLPHLMVKAQQYLMQGVLNRYLTIEENWRWIFFNLPVDRKESLSTHGTRVASVHLNSIYLHIQGVLDNFAWLFIHQLDVKLAGTIKRTDVFLYSKKILELLPESPEKDKIKDFSSWYKEVCMKRHPVAHRLPLHIPSQILPSKEAAAKSQELETQYFENINRFAKESKEALVTNPLDLDIHGLNKRNQDVTERINKYEKEQQAIEKEIEKLGTFTPGFMYPEESVIYPIYPTVTEDIKNLDTITNECLSIIKEICSKI